MMTTYTDQIKLSAPIPGLDLAQGDSLQDALEAIAEKFADIDKVLEKELFPSGPTDISAKHIKYTGDDTLTGSLSAEAIQLEGSLLKVEATRQDQAVDVTFKAADFTLPAGAKIARSTVNVSGQRDQGRTEIANHTRNTEATMSIGYNRFPVIVDARVVVSMPDGGEVELKKTIQIDSAESFSQETPYELIDRTTKAKSTDLEAAFKQMSARVKSLENRKAGV